MDEVKRDYRYPTFRYRLKDGKVEKRLFESAPPQGWHRSPADLDVPKHRGRPKGSKNKPRESLGSLPEDEGLAAINSRGKRERD